MLDTVTLSERLKCPNCDHRNVQYVTLEHLETLGAKHRTVFLYRCTRCLYAFQDVVEWFRPWQLREAVNSINAYLKGISEEERGNLQHGFFKWTEVGRWNQDQRGYELDWSKWDRLVNGNRYY